MRKNLFIGLLGIATMLASCSQNEDLLQGTEAQKKSSVTFTVNVGGDMKTRAYSEDPAWADIKLKAFIAEAPLTDKGYVDYSQDPKITELETTGDGDNGFTVTAEMTSDKAYRLMFWASKEGEYQFSSEAVVTPTAPNAPGIAFTGETGYHKYSEYANDPESTNIILEHSVAKVTLHTTTAIPANSTVTLKVPTYTSYDLLDGLASGEATATDTYTAETETAANSNLCSVYAITSGSVLDDCTQTVSITYGGRTKEIENVPVKKGYSITLTGDVDGLSVKQQNFTITLDKDWNEVNSGIQPATKTYTSSELDAVADLKAALLENGVNGILKLSGTGFTASHMTKIKDALNDDILRYTLDMSSFGTETLETRELGNAAFYGCEGLKEIRLPYYLETIGEQAFAQAKNLEVFDLSGNPGFLKTIKSMAFAFCPKLKQIDLSGQGVTILENFVFYNCSALEEVRLGNIVSEMKQRVFQGCENLKVIDCSLCDAVPSLNTSADNGTFNGVNTTAITVYVKDEAMKAAFTAEGSQWLQAGFTADNFVVK